MSNLMQLAITLAEIEPEQSFQTVEAMTQPINEYVEASAIVSKYRNEGTLRQGEMVLNAYGGVSGFYNLNPILTKLKNKDSNARSRSSTVSANRSSRKFAASMD
jgi:hypothetical protein